MGRTVNECEFFFDNLSFVTGFAERLFGPRQHLSRVIVAVAMNQSIAAVQGAGCAVGDVQVFVLLVVEAVAQSL